MIEVMCYGYQESSCEEGFCQKAAAQKGAPKNNGSESKSLKATEYMKSHPGLSRKALLEVLINQIGLSPKGSATYYFTLKKKLNYKLSSCTQDEPGTCYQALLFGSTAMKRLVQVSAFYRNVKPDGVGVTLMEDLDDPFLGYVFALIQTFALDVCGHRTAP